jgi:transposase
LSPTLPAACTDEKTGIWLLTSGARQEAPGFDLVWHDLPNLPALAAAVMDKAYDSEAMRQVLHKQGREAVSPGKTNRLAEMAYDKEQYKLLQKVERFFNKLTQFRRIAPRYGQRGRTFLALMHLVATWIMIR